jgi:4-oxalocrotonate tautomerase
MPFVNIKLIENIFTAEQKQQMIERVTDAIVSVEGENLRPLTLVIIDDTVKSGDWGIGGRGATVEMIQEIREGKTKPPKAA